MVVVIFFYNYDNLDYHDNLKLLVIESRISFFLAFCHFHFSDAAPPFRDFQTLPPPFPCRSRPSAMRKGCNHTANSMLWLRDCTPFISASILVFRVSNTVLRHYLYVVFYLLYAIFFTIKKLLFPLRMTYFKPRYGFLIFASLLRHFRKSLCQQKVRFSCILTFCIFAYGAATTQTR